MTGRAAAWLPLMIRLTAIGYLAFFVPNLILAATHRGSARPRLHHHGPTGGMLAAGPARLDGFVDD
jgi:hypothetical protein